MSNLFYPIQRLDCTVLQADLLLPLTRSTMLSCLSILLIFPAMAVAVLTGSAAGELTAIFPTAPLATVSPGIWASENPSAAATFEAAFTSLVLANPTALPSDFAYAKPYARTRHLMADSIFVDPLLQRSRQLPSLLSSSTRNLRSQRSLHPLPWIFSTTLSQLL